MKKRTFMLMGTMLAAAVLSGAALAEETEEPVVIAQAMPTLNNPWYVLFANGSADMAEVLGVEFSQVTNPGTAEWDPSAQIGIIENLIAKKPDVIEIDPTSTDGINSAVDEAMNQGIHVVMSGTRVSTTVDSSITADNYQGGVLCGEEMAKLLDGEGKIVILDATPGRDVMQNRVDGFKSVIEQYEGIEIVAEQIANSDRAEAVTVMETILQANSDIDGVWAANDEMALGAVEALRALGMEQDVIVGGFDATDDAVSAVSTGEMNFTANQIPYEIGVRAIAVSYMVAKGMEIPGEDISLEMSMINQENVEAYLNEQEEQQAATIEQVLEEYGLK